MNGAESLMETAVASGVEVCFANPGTTEMPLVAALDKVRGMRAVLGLFEGVCTGAADGYGRMANKPALTLLHLGPGFANGIANLHNARRARSPVVNLIGDHATWHVGADAPLTSDIVSLASPVSAWVHTSGTATELPADAGRAIAVASTTPGCVATLIVPADTQWEESTGAVPAPTFESPEPLEEFAVADAARALRSKEPSVLLLGGHGLRERGLRAASRIAAKTGCRIVTETFFARMERGAGLPTIERLPYFPEQVLETLDGTRQLVLAGAVSPVAFFGYPGGASQLVPEGCTPHPLVSSAGDVVAALEALADELGAKGTGPVQPAEPPPTPTGAIDPQTFGQAVASVQPEGTIVVDEAATTGLGYFFASAGAPPFTLLGLTGGAIGQGPPSATGAAIACPDRPVLNLQADGSAFYTMQALWTQARENLNVTTVICSNRSYRILQIELVRSGVAEPGPKALGLTSLEKPEVDWTSIAKGLGVPAVRVDRCEDLAKEVERSLAEPGPKLIDAVIV